MDLQNLTDEELISLAQKDNKDAASVIIERYKNTVKAITRSYFLIGGDNEDLFQEGLIALFNAVVSFNGKSGFRNYVYTCVRNSIVSIIRKYNSNKNIPMINYLSLTGYTDGDLDKSNVFINEEISDPETDFINRESSEELRNLIISSLSKLENKILLYYLQGFSYFEIAEKTSKNIKAIDNALQRIRLKVSAIIYSDKLF